MNTKKEHGKIDWMITLVPLAIVIALCVLFFFAPEQSNAVLSQIRFFFGDTFGTYYLVIGLGIFILSLYIAGSKYGNIVLGEQNEKPKYSFFAWGSMMFTCGLAADILFYSFSEWVLYATDPHLAEMGSIQDWAGVYPLFHWSFIPWGFYLVLAVAFGFMLHVRKRNRQKYSEACRPILGKYTDGWAGRIIDLLAVFALLAGTATTFSVATPLMATIISEMFHVAVSRTVINIIILLITCAVYTYSLLHGFKGISKLANICIYMFFGLIAFVLLFGGETRYIIETGFSSLGRMIQNFVDLSTFTDPLRTSNFPQNWTIYYWAYWMVWCVAAPFFIGSISRGRTVRQTILGGYVFGVGSTLTSFIVLGNYSMGMQVTGKADFIAQYLENGDLYGMIVSINVYQNGYVIYRAHKRVTVFSLRDCVHYKYDAAEGAGLHIEEAEFDDYEWHIRLVLEGEDRIFMNYEIIQGKWMPSREDREYKEEILEGVDEAVSTLERMISEERVEELLSTLTDLQRKVVHIHLFHGLSFTEAAKHLGMTRQNLTGIYNAAIYKIQKKYFRALCSC